MSTTPLPAGQTIPAPDEVDAGWMTEVMRSAGVAGEASVEVVEFVGFIGTGQMGRNVRYRLTWDDAGEGLPASVVGKFPSEVENARATGFNENVYYKEHAFYSELAPRASTRTPQAYTSLFDEPGQSFVIMMEDLDGSVQGDQLAGLSPDQAALAVAEAVGFHAPFWGDRSLDALIGRRQDASAQLEMLMAMTHQAAIERLGDAIDTEAAQLIADLAAVSRQWALSGQARTTLAHLDYRPDNFMFGVAPEAPPLAVVDWQTIAVAAGCVDIAYAIGGGFDPDQRADIERELVADYASRLRAAGIDYSDETAWHDYRLGSLWGVAIGTMAVVLAEQTERGNEMLATMLRRHARHALDLDALTLVVTRSAAD